MPISIVAASAIGSSTSVNNLVVNVPASQAGDISVICIANNMASAGTLTPAGWTALFGSGVNVGASNGSASVFWRAWQPGDPATVTFTTTNTGRWVALPFRVRGALLSAPFPVVGSTSVGSVAAGTSITAPSVSAPAAGMELITFHSGRGTTSGTFGSWTPPVAMTEVLAGGSSSGVNNSMGEVNTKHLTAAGPTGTQSARCSVALTAAALTFVIAPAPAASTVMKMKGGATVVTRYKGQP